MDTVDESGQPGIREAVAAENLDLRFSRREVVLLARYSVAKVALEQLRAFFLAKWLVLVAAVPLLIFFDAALVRVGAILLVVVFVALYVAQWLLRAALTRVGAFRRLQEFDAHVEDLRGNVREEFERVGGAVKPTRVVGTAVRLARGGRSADQLIEEYLTLDWARVLRIKDIGAARRALAEAAGDP